MQIVIAGSSGFLGTALRRHLERGGHDVVRLVRRPAGEGESQWDPYAGAVDQAVINDADVVVNLAASPTVGNPHSQKWARKLVQSRLTTTEVLAEAVARAVGHGSPTAYLAGNGISYYGDHGSEVLDEQSESRGSSLLTDLTRRWAAATEQAVAAGARVCVLRTAPVIDRRNAPLKEMKTAWRFGLGARIGDGGQYFPIISLRDWVAAATHLATLSSASGAFNLCCPVTPTNREFTDALAEALGRRARLAVPAAAVRLGAGPMAPELLNSVRAEPTALLADGFVFLDDDVRAVIRAGLAS